MEIGHNFKDLLVEVKHLLVGLMDIGKSRSVAWWLDQDVEQVKCGVCFSCLSLKDELENHCCVGCNNTICRVCYFNAIAYQFEIQKSLKDYTHVTSTCEKCVNNMVNRSEYKRYCANVNIPDTPEFQPIAKTSNGIVIPNTPPMNQLTRSQQMEEIPTIKI